MTGAPTFIAEIHDLHDLGSVGRGERAAENREILGEQEHASPVDRAVTGDDAIAEHLLVLHAEVGAAMHDEPIELDEAARVEQEIDALARRELAGGMLPIDTGLAPAFERLFVQLVEGFDHVRHRAGDSTTARSRQSRDRRSRRARPDACESE